jgi:hypothetical protein
MTRLKTFFKYSYLRHKIRFKKLVDQKRVLDENEKLIKNVDVRSRKLLRNIIKKL